MPPRAVTKISVPVMYAKSDLAVAGERRHPSGWAGISFSHCLVVGRIRADRWLLFGRSYALSALLGQYLCTECAHVNSGCALSAFLGIEL